MWGSHKDDFLYRKTPREQELEILVEDTEFILRDYIRNGYSDLEPLVKRMKKVLKKKTR